MKQRMKAALPAAIGLTIAATVSFAARPLIIDDAVPLDFQQCKIEGGGWYEKDAGCHDWLWPVGLGYGLVPSLEVNLGLGGTFQQQLDIDESGRECVSSAGGMGDLLVSAKWQFLDESRWIPRQAVVPTVKFPTADRDNGLGSGEMDCDVTWIASKSLPDKWGVHFNLGYAFIGKPPGEDAGDVIHYGASVDYIIADPLQWVGEIYAEKELLGGTSHVVIFNTGLRWTVIDGLVLDAAAGSSISRAGPDLTATAGFTWEFGFRGEKGKENK